MLDVIFDRVMRNLAVTFWVVLSCKVTGQILLWTTGFRYES